MRNTDRFVRSLPNIWAVIAALVMAMPAVAQQPAGAWGQGAAKNKSNGHYADVNGIRLYYEIHGSGPPLVLLHGGLGAIEMFGPNLPALAKGHRVIAVDLQGHGRTADIDRPMDPKLMAGDIAALLDHIKVTQADIVGYSLGSWVALHTAAQHPEKVRKVVLASAPFRRNGFYPDILAQQAQVNASMVEQMKQTPMYQLYQAVAPRPQDFPRLLDKMGEAMKTEYDYSEQVKQLRAPTLIVAGDADIFPPSHAVEMFALLGGGLKDPGWDGSGRPKSQMAILPGLNHYNLFADPRLAATVEAFLAEP